MSIIAVVADQERYANLERNWVLETQHAVAVDRGLCAVHPASSTSDPDWSALAFVRSLRYTAGEHRTDARTADILVSALASAERTGNPHDLIDRAAALLTGIHANRHFASVFGAHAELGALRAQPRSPMLSDLVESPCELLDEVAAWSPGTRVLHWDLLLTEQTNVLVRHINDHVTGLHLYGLVEQSNHDFTVLIDETIESSTVVEEMFPDRCYRMPAAFIENAATAPR